MSVVKIAMRNAKAFAAVRPCRDSRCHWFPKKAIVGSAATFGEIQLFGKMQGRRFFLQTPYAQSPG